MWHLIEDFMEQSLVMKGFIGLGWLAIIIMIFSLGTTGPEVFNLMMAGS